MPFIGRTRCRLVVLEPDAVPNTTLEHAHRSQPSRDQTYWWPAQAEGDENHIPIYGKNNRIPVPHIAPFGISTFLIGQ